jgi:dihydroorotase (multifunctional complex type)
MVTLIANGKVWIDGQLQEVSIAINEGGRITGLLSPDPTQPVNINKWIDASGLIVLPGHLDMHAHLQDGAETFFPGTCAAAAGGITTVVDMPPFHGCVTPSGCQERKQLGEEQCVVDFMLGGGIVVSHEDLNDMEAVKHFGAPFFKVFMPAQPPVDAALLWAAVQTAAHTGLRMVIHAEDASCLNLEVDWEDPVGFAHARPVVAETSATSQVLEMARAAGAPVHICHVSAGRTAELIDAYWGWGTDVTAETTPHFLLLDESAFLTLGSRVKTTPPLRSKTDTEILWQALSDGVIDVVVSDHFLDELPYPGEVDKPLREKGPGIAGLELTMPLLYDACVVADRISLERLVQVTSSSVADILGVADRKGRIRVGLDADFVLIDPNATWKVNHQGDFSRNSTSPYENRELQGRVVKTIVRGEIVWDGHDILTGRGYGMCLQANNE